MNDMRKYNVNDDYFECLNHEQYWLIGLLASDGYIGKHNQIGITQSGDAGYKLITYIKNIIHSDSPIRTIKTKGKDAHQLIFSSEKIRKKLEYFNIVRSKTKIYQFPKIPLDYINDFIAGYVEGDGCITISNNGVGCKYLCVSFVGTKDFMERCCEVIPIKGTLRKHSMSDVYELRWNGEQAIYFCDWLYNSDDLYHGYKYDNYIIAKELHKDTRKERYASIKDSVLSDFANNKIESVTKYASSIKIPFQTIYKWKREWIREGLL